MKIIIALHDDDQSKFYTEEAKAIGCEVVIPSQRNAESILILLDQEPSPDKVLMDANYGHPNGRDFEIFKRIKNKMTLRGYNPTSDLLGVTGRDDTAEDMKREYLNVAKRPEDTLKILKFLAS